MERQPIATPRQVHLGAYQAQGSDLSDKEIVVDLLDMFCFSTRRACESGLFHCGFRTCFRELKGVHQPSHAIEALSEPGFKPL